MVRLPPFEAFYQTGGGLRLRASLHYRHTDEEFILWFARAASRNAWWRRRRSRKQLAMHLPSTLVAKIDELRLKSYSLSCHSSFLVHYHLHHQRRARQTHGHARGAQPGQLRAQSEAVERGIPRSGTRSLGSPFLRSVCPAASSSRTSTPPLTREETTPRPIETTRCLPSHREMPPPWTPAPWPRRERERGSHGPRTRCRMCSSSSSTKQQRSGSRPRCGRPRPPWSSNVAGADGIARRRCGRGVHAVQRGGGAARGGTTAGSSHPLRRWTRREGEAVSRTTAAHREEVAGMSGRELAQAWPQKNDFQLRSSGAWLTGRFGLSGPGYEACSGNQTCPSWPRRAWSGWRQETKQAHKL